MSDRKLKLIGLPINTPQTKRGHVASDKEPESKNKMAKSVKPNQYFGIYFNKYPFFTSLEAWSHLKAGTIRNLTDNSVDVLLGQKWQKAEIVAIGGEII